MSSGIPKMSLLTGEHDPVQRQVIGAAGVLEGAAALRRRERLGGRGGLAARDRREQELAGARAARPRRRSSSRRVPQAAARPAGPGPFDAAARSHGDRGASRRSRRSPHADRAASCPPVREVYEALVLGTRDYVRKNGFSDVHIALSGGVDSAIVATIAVDALGAEHVTGVLMPSRFSSDHSVTDAEAIAANLGIATLTVPIEPAHAGLRGDARRRAREQPPGLAEENVQSRIRGNVMMTISNKLGSLGAHDREQERDGDRLRHALRRHGRRLRRDQGRAQDARVRAVRRPQRARRSRADSRRAC